MKAIEGVPESISREQYLGLIADLGLDVNMVRALKFHDNGVYADVKACMPGQDKDFLTSDGYDTQCATHRIFIPVVD